MCPSPNDPNGPQPKHTFADEPEVTLNAQAQAHEAYIASIAHDLKNPLTTIMGRVELMKRLLQRAEITPADLQRHLAPLEAAVQRLNSLLENISQTRGEGLSGREQGR
jgi:signal transduction histidine kinase